MSVQRYHEDNAAYFVTFVTEERKKLFRDPLVCQLLLNILTYNKFICRYNIYAFVIMPEHCHLILQAVGDMRLPGIMQKIKGNFSRFYNQLEGTSGTVLQKGYFDEVIRNQKQLNETIQYIHNNPVKNGLVSNIEDYCFSSYQYYEQGNRDFSLLLRIIE